MSDKAQSAFTFSKVLSPTRLPKYRHHKAGGQGVVVLRGQYIYLGVYDSPESHERYHTVIAEYIAARGVTPEQRAHLTVADLILQYWRYAQECYSAETLAGSIKPALQRLRRFAGLASVAKFGPLKLKAFRQGLLNETTEGGRQPSRPYINRLVRQVRSLFKWGVGEELVPSSMFNGLLAVEGIRCDGAGLSYQSRISMLIHKGQTYAVRIAGFNGAVGQFQLNFDLHCGTADFIWDGDIGTDADIEAFFACLAASCCPTCGSADFNGDGDIGTDADIESFFSVLAGGPC